MRKKQRKPGKSIGEPYPVIETKTPVDAGNDDPSANMETDDKSTDPAGDPEDNIDDIDNKHDESINNNIVINDCSLSKVAALEEFNLQHENELTDGDELMNVKPAFCGEADIIEDSNDAIVDTSDSEGKLVIETNSEAMDIDNENTSSSISELDNVKTPSSQPVALGDHDTDLNRSDACISHSSLQSHREDLCLPDASSITLPVMSDILDGSNSCDTTNSSHDLSVMSSPHLDSSKLTVDKPKVPYKGTMVPCGKLKDYLDSLPTFNRKCMLRKGREVHKIYVDMTKGESFLDDQFAYTEFGRMVLTNGSIRAGRAKNAKQIVVARETLYCSGTVACKRACGGYGICLPGCDKTKMRGHRCSYRIKLTQRLGFVNFWFVEELGSHDQLNGKDCDFKVNSQLAANAATTKENPVMDLSSGGFKFRAANIPRPQKKLAPKSATPSPDRSRGPADSKNKSVSDIKSESQTNYHYVLGLMPNNSPSRESPLNGSDQGPENNLSSQQKSAISALMDPAMVQASTLATVAMTGATSIPQDMASQIYQANLLNYFSTMQNLGIGAINPVLVNVKQEPQDGLSTQGQLAVQGQGPLGAGYPFISVPPQLQYASSQLMDSVNNFASHSPSSKSQGHSPSSKSQGHSPSPSRGQSPSVTPRGQSYRERSPLVWNSTHLTGVKKGLEIEAKIKKESSQKMQAGQEILGQVHSRIMERAKSRKSAHTVRVKQQNNDHDSQVLDLTSNSNSTDIKHVSNTSSNIPSSVDISPSPVDISPSNLVDNNAISSLAYQRFQTLNRVLHSDAFQAAKNQLEKKKKVLDAVNKQEESCAPLNLVKNSSKTENSNFNVLGQNLQQNYFRLAEEWQKGGQLTSWDDDDECEPGVTNGEHLNGHLGPLEYKGVIETDKLTDNEKELMCRVRQLESHVKQLQNIVIKNDVSTSAPLAGKKRIKPQRDFDFTRYNTRHVALKIMYLGCDYSGYASQEDNPHTVEAVLLDALKKTRLVENRETAHYERCGRTDKGVSAFGQVISIDLRTNLLSGVGVKVREGGTAADRPGDKTTEIQYCHIINKNLPPEIRVLAWAPVDCEFSSRFSCKKRTYKYFFPKGNLNLDLMKEACKKLIGEHDFRNFCKMDVANGVTNYVRKILSAEINVIDGEDEVDGYTMYELTIVGTAFLYHQIRCIVSILFFIGREQETAQIIDELLDVVKNPRKPQYALGADFPLCLFDAEYGDDFEWIYEADWHEDNIKHLQQLWAEHSIKAMMLKKMLESLDKAKVETECDIAPWSDLSPPVLHQSNWLAANHFKVHKPLLERHLAPTLEEKIESISQAKKRKLAAVDTGDEKMTGEQSTE